MEIVVNQAIKEISNKYNKYDFYLFGSYTNNEKKYGDIDILILYETPELIDNIRLEFQNIVSYENFDLMFLSNEEEKEIKFVEKVNAKKV